MASTGSSMPTIRPTSRAHRPPALTTCSVDRVAALEAHVPRPSAAAPADDRRVLVDLGARIWAHFT